MCVCVCVCFVFFFFQQLICNSSKHDRPPRASRTPSTSYTHTLPTHEKTEGGRERERTHQPLRAVEKKRKGVNAPSMSTLLPIVRFHCFPARAIRRSRRSPSIERRFDGGRSSVVELAASSADGGAPEKKAWMLYISL